MIRLKRSGLPRAVILVAALSCPAQAGWVVVSDGGDYVAYADPDSISREGDRVRMSDLVDLKSPQNSPQGGQHSSSVAHSEFDCRTPRMRSLAFSLHSGRMGNGEVVETAVESGKWLSIAPGTLLDLLRQFACG